MDASALSGHEVRWRPTSHGDALLVERRFPLEYMHGGLALAEGAVVPLPSWMPDAARPEDLLFLDTETTGLAGGAGTLAFLICAGRFEGSEFVLRQILLLDLHQERAQVAALHSLLEESNVAVHYNGKTFDLPILEARFILNGLRLPGHFAQLDLLHHSRRIFRGLTDSCRLQEIEARFLGLERQGDCPGWEIPARYFRYQTTRDFRLLDPILEHNALDVLSLVTLLGRLRLACAESEESHLLQARTLVLRGRRLEAARAYETAAAGSLGRALREECLEQAAALYKRFRHWNDACRQWEALLESSGGRYISPRVELAKVAEHEWRDLEEARRQTMAAIEAVQAGRGHAGAPGSQTSIAALLQRLARIERRLGRSAEPRDDQPLPREQLRRALRPATRRVPPNGEAGARAGSD
jgi:uncharacterized protein YprB with RNaseH-like and TPR domain